MSNRYLYTPSIFFTLIKWKLSLLVSFSAFTAFVIYAGTISWAVIIPLVGVFCLSGGASSLNQYQERAYDGRMKRTRNRPIPSGRIHPILALSISVLLMLTGAMVLFFLSGKLAAFLGLLNVILYNVIYTPLKKKTAFAVIPGAMIGAITPMIGWLAAGGILTDPRIIAISIFVFIWQVPHFWILLFRYDNDYKEAGFPSIFNTFSREQFTRITFIWVLSTTLSSIVFLLFRMITFLPIELLLLVINALLIFSFLNFLGFGNRKANFQTIFIRFNVYMAAVMLLLVVSALISF